MRTPATKVYRAFPELDQFTDEQCRGYVKRAIAKHTASMIGVGLIAALLTIATAALSFIFAGSLDDALQESRYWIWFLRNRADLLVAAIRYAAPPITALLVGLLCRDLWLRWAIGCELKRSTCPKCEYQLLGLPVSGSAVRCPECGVQTRLDLLNLRPEDLAMPDDSARGLPKHPPLAPPLRREQVG